MFVRHHILPIVALALFAGCQGQDTDSAGAAATPASSEVASDAPAPTTADGSTIVARVGGDEITASELDEWIRNDLFERSWNNDNELYKLRVEAVDRMVTEHLLEREAASRNLDVESFVQAEVEAKGEISDEEVANFYEEQNDKMGGMTLEQIAPRIREFIRQMRASEFIQELRDGAEVSVLLEQPRIEVAADGPSKGPDDARVTIIEFSDFQCPYCSRAIPVIDEIMKRYPDDVRIVYRHLPLERIHARARPAAEASACADEQGKFWPYHDLLFENAKALADEDLKRYATDLGLDVAAWEECFSSGRFRLKVQEDLAAGHEAGISSTPAFLVNGLLVSGAKPVEAFATIIDAELADKDES